MPLTDIAKRHLFRWLRAGFRLTPLPAAARIRLRQRFLDRYGGLVPPGPQGIAPVGAATGHRALRHAAGRAIGYTPYREAPSSSNCPVKFVAFYLPQFHPIPENDAWREKGFTEWNKVTRALPQYEGHQQPRLPGELGFYDLRSGEVMHRQMELAREYGISAFCAYFYWCGGKTLLEAPLRQWLGDPSLSMPICLCWANENWSRRWDGRAQDILIRQQYSETDDLAFIGHVSAYMKDARYLRINGRPALLVYRPGLLPEPRITAQRWREWCREHGIGEIYLAYVQSFDRVDPRSIGFDAAIEFPPNNTSLEPVTARQRLINPGFQGDVFDWRQLAQAAESAPDPAYPCYPGVNPGWDNEPRRSGGGRVFQHASPRRYKQWLQSACVAAERRLPLHPMVFINAWNEWAEGAVLEPDTRLGYAWLEATRQARGGVGGPLPDLRPCAIIHAWYVDVLEELIEALRASGVAWRIIITTAPERVTGVRDLTDRLHLDAEIAVYENRGRDVLPFLRVADRLYDEGVGVVLKIHTKRSTHRNDGVRWRKELIDRLLAPELAPRILQAFREQPNVGMVAAGGHIQPLSYFWGANEANVDYLCRRIGIDMPSPVHDRFIAGTMFWTRLEAIRPLLDAHLGLDEFEDEAAQLDGTLAHAIERIFCLAASGQGFETMDVSTACGLSPSAGISTPYPYANRSG